MKWTMAVTMCVFALAVAFGGDPSFVGAKPKAGYAPDAKTAIKIAVAVWEPIYGESNITKEKPYRAVLLSNTVWKVEGSLPEGWVGGVATAFIAKDDARIMNVFHGR